MNQSEFNWKTFPDTEVFINQMIEEACSGNEDIRSMSRRVAEQTATPFREWIESLTLSGGNLFEIERLGYSLKSTYYGQKLFVHQKGCFPALRIFPGPVTTVRSLTLKIESLSVFRYLSGFFGELDGTPGSNYSRILLSDHGGILLFAAERNADCWMPEEIEEQQMLEIREAHDLIAQRRRFFDPDEDGWKYTDRLFDRVISLVGEDRCAALFLKHERRFWEARNTAAKILKARQDKLGLGWGNHDHHSFRSGRSSFPRLVRLFERMGFSGRERFVSTLHDTGRYGVQVFEHEGLGAVITTHVDLSEGEAETDFAHAELPPLCKLGPVGLWTALHGESIFEAGLFHLGVRYDYWQLKKILDGLGIEIREPASESPFLLRAGLFEERWIPTARRRDALRGLGALDSDDTLRLSREGSPGSHIECVHRVDGFKGFTSAE